MKKEKYEAIEAKECSGILRSAMKERGTTQVDIADRLGMVQSSISGLINRKRMTVDGLQKLLDVMEYDITITDRRTGETRWKVKKEC